MRILVICQYYAPEPFRISDICEELVRRGHEIQVVTGLPNYPMGEIYEGYRHGEKRDEVINGVKVHRCFTFGRKTGTFHRMLNYFSYPFTSTRYVSHLQEDYDVVFVNQLSPVMMAQAGIRYKKKHHKKLILYCLDLWPESLAVGNVSKNSLAYRFFHRISKRIYKEADQILITSRMFRKYFEQEFGITKNITYLPQYAESVFDPISCRKKPNGFIDLMFAGNIGTAQSVKTIIEAAAKCRDISNLRWHIVGDGSDLEKCKQLAHRLQVDNGIVTFYGRKPLEEMPHYYAMADAMLVTMQHDPVLAYTLPGKVQTYMAAGKPIIGAIDGETQAVIREAQCGTCCDAEDSEGLAWCVKQFINSFDYDKVLIEICTYYEKQFSRNFFIYRMEEELKNARSND